LDINIPGLGKFRLQHVVLDVNGTVAAGGQLIGGVRKVLHSLRADGWQVHWITADTRGRQAALDAEMGWPAARLDGDDPAGESQQKADFVRQLGSDRVVAVGNGVNDVGMLREAALGIAVLGPEGLALDAIMAADAIAPDIHAALDMVADPSRLVGTLRR
jgi:P-type E1-E2 ATPase